MVRTPAAAFVLALVLCASASATESTIYPGVGIGKVELGMPLTQVRKLLGPPQLVNKREDLAQGRRYVEYLWNFGEWRVGFAGGSSLHVVVVATAARIQRTANGVGVGTGLVALRRKLPVSACYLGKDGRYHKDSRYLDYCIFGADRHVTFFDITPKNCDPPWVLSLNACEWYVIEIAVDDTSVASRTVDVVELTLTTRPTRPLPFSTVSSGLTPSRLPASIVTVLA